MKIPTPVDRQDAQESISDPAVQNAQNRPICIALWATISAIAVLLALTLTPLVAGDGHEYALQLEAWFAHASPDVRLADANRLLDLVQREEDHFYNLAVLQDFQRSLTKGTNYGGLYGDGEGKVYGYHFPFYALLAVPAKAILRYVGWNELRAFQLTNALLISGVVAYLLFFSHLNLTVRVLGCVAWLLCGTAYYFAWPHPEILISGSLLTASLMFHDGRLRSGLIVGALPALQFPPSACAVFLMIALYLFGQRTRIRVLLRDRWLLVVGAVAILIALGSPLFYFAHFGKWSLTAGFADSSLITWGRLMSLYLDLNQGLLCGAPGLILGAAILCGVRIGLHIRRKDIRNWPKHDWLLIVVAVVSVSVIGQVNWNGGGSIFLRYAYWLSGLLVAWCMLNVQWLDGFSPATFVLVVVGVIQGAMNIYYAPLQSTQSYEYLTMKPFARTILEWMPMLYDPDPIIFAARVAGRDVDFRKGTFAIVNPTTKAYSKVLLATPSAQQTLSSLCSGSSLINSDTGEKVTLNEIDFSPQGTAYLSGAFSCALDLPATVLASSDGFLQFAQEGFSSPESWGTWTDGQHASLRFPLSRIPSRPIVLSFTALLFNGYPTANVDVIANGVPVGRLSYISAETFVQRSVIIPPSAIGSDRILRVQLKFAETIKLPSELGLAYDRRRLGLGVTSFSLAER